MVAIEYVGQEKKLSKVIQEKYKTLSYSNIQKLLRKKDIKVNTKRVSSDIVVKSGDNIEIYATPQMLEPKSPNLSVVYDDDNIIVVSKPLGIEVEGFGENISLTTVVNNYLLEKEQKSAVAVHRIDRNTRGLVIFAKTKLAEEELLKAFKNHNIKKFYNAIVVGEMPKKQDTLIAYLWTDKQKAMSFVSSSPKPGYEKIITKYKVMAYLEEDKTLVEVELVTGKTHQIRAHFAFIGHALVGDGKYGKNQVNKFYNQKTQALLAKRIEFCFDKTSPLEYLNKKVIETNQNLI